MLAAQRYYLIAFVAFFVLLSLTTFHFSNVGPAVRKHAESYLNRTLAKAPYRYPNPTLRDAVTTLFHPLKHDPSNPKYRAPDGKEFEADSIVWSHPLGKRILIVDIDTRVPSGDNQILNPQPLDFEHLDPSGGGLVSNAILNHYMYAMVHGYDYKYYQAQHIPDHYDTWIMPHVFRELVPNYDFVVAMDADAMVPHLEVPLEWMFNRWGIKKHTSMALPWDTEEFRGEDQFSISRDSKGLRVLNTGLVIAQNSPLTLDLLEAWRDCTTEKRYPGCAEWKTQWSHEQRAFSEYIRYDFNRTPETVVSIPCDDAVGYPHFKELNEHENERLSDCNGNFVRHYTFGKKMAKDAGAYTLMQSMSTLIQKSVLRQSDAIWYKEPPRTPEKSDVSQDSNAPDHVDKEKVEEAQSEIRKQDQEKAAEREDTKDEEATPVMLDGMSPADAKSKR